MGEQLIFYNFDKLSLEFPYVDVIFVAMGKFVTLATTHARDRVSFWDPFSAASSAGGVSRGSVWVLEGREPCLSIVPARKPSENSDTL